MGLLPARPPSFLEKYWKQSLAGFVFVVLVFLTLWAISRANTKARDMETLAQVNEARSALGLYFYNRYDYPPAGAVLDGQKTLGQGDAACLDKTDEGLKGLCEKDWISRRLPSAGFVYRKPTLGDYELLFNLEGRVDNLVDLNKNGKIECRAAKEGIECR